MNVQYPSISVRNNVQKKLEFFAQAATMLYNEAKLICMNWTHLLEHWNIST